MSKPYGIVYMAVSPGGKRYIGQTTGTLANRRAQHYSDARGGKKGCRHFHNALSKHGEEAFIWTILSYALSEGVLNELERIYINLYNATDRKKGYNLKEGGGGGGKHAPESRKQMSETRTGMKRSPEAIERTAAAHRGRKRSPEVRANISKGKMGKKPSAEARANISKGSMGKKRSPEAIEKTAAVHRGMKRSPAARANIKAGIQAAKERREQDKVLLSNQKEQ